jgi:hypothetical protein
MREATNEGRPAGFPRCMSRKDIEQTYGFKPAVFSRLVAKGLMPPRLPGTRLWDSRAIEFALDTLAGLDHARTINAETAADRWFREQGGEG